MTYHRISLELHCQNVLILYIRNDSKSSETFDNMHNTSRYYRNYFPRLSKFIFRNGQANRLVGMVVTNMTLFMPFQVILVIE